jgi:hypothetical protein
MFSAPRFVVIDDKKEHLAAIVETFQRLGSPCMGIRYDAATGLDFAHLRNVRCLFLDLHLVDSQAATDNRRHFALIAQILEDGISEVGGPFALVVWTEHPHLCDDLRAYLETRLDAAKPHTRPVAVLSLPKEKFISVGDGTATAPTELRDAVLAAVTSNPQLAALLEWEADVMTATGETLASLIGLVPAPRRTGAEFPQALDEVLSRLAQEAVGPSNVDADPRAAVVSVLAPILSDRIMNQRPVAAPAASWKQAVTRHGDKALPPAEAAEASAVNRMLHIASPSSEAIRPTDWGAVVQWPFGWTDQHAARVTGLTCKQMVCDEFRMRSSAIPNCSAMLVRVGAVCDYAQSNRGPITYLFALQIPEGAERQMKDGTAVKRSEAIWQSPVFLPPGFNEPSRLHVHVRFPTTVLPDACAGWTSAYRLREQLLMQLISAASGYVARPGIVQLPVKPV